MRPSRNIAGKAFHAAAFAALAVLTGCDSQAPATVKAPAPAANIAASRCQPAPGGTAPVVAELETYRRELQQQAQSGLLDDNDFFSATQDLEAVNAAMARKDFAAACGLADTLRANYGLGQ